MSHGADNDSAADAQMVLTRKVTSCLLWGASDRTVLQRRQALRAALDLLEHGTEEHGTETPQTTTKEELRQLLLQTHPDKRGTGGDAACDAVISYQQYKKQQKEQKEQKQQKQQKQRR
tara:strand:- start:181 stop:534 length:354 start_codon:yes stop_codon:yes gene_type:complete